MVSLNSSKITGVYNSRFVLFLSTKVCTKYCMCYLNKTITTLNHSVIIAGFVKFISRLFFIFGLFLCTCKIMFSP